MCIAVQGIVPMTPENIAFCEMTRSLELVGNICLVAGAIAAVGLIVWFAMEWFDA
jgi:hypothetical protein